MIDAALLDQLIRNVGKVAGLSATALEQLVVTINEAVTPVIDAQLASERRWIMGMAKLADELACTTRLSREEALQLVTALGSQTPSHFEGAFDMVLRMLIQHMAEQADPADLD